MKKPITPTQRYAVYTVHGEKCYLCTKPIDFASSEVDHIIPESLQQEPGRLEAIIELFGLPSSFNLHSYENWMPACRPCNNLKRNIVFHPSPLVQLQLQKAHNLAADATKIAYEATGDKKVDRAVNVLLAALEARTLDQSVLLPLVKHFAQFHLEHRAQEAEGRPLLISPAIRVLAKGPLLEIVQGPYGIGGGPTSENVQLGARCGSCGGHHWNGARCVLCGAMDDGD